MSEFLDRFTNEIERLVKRHLRYSGAVALEWLANQDAIDFRKSDLRLILESKGYFGVDENWYISFEYVPGSLEKNSVLHRSLLKMFQYCGPLHIQDIYFGIEHTLIKMEFPKPPINILKEILIQYRYTFEDGLWYWDGVADEELNNGEKIILHTIRENNGVAHHSELAQAIVDSKLSFPSLHATLRRSPIFEKLDHLGRGLYKLRGSQPSLEAIERARSASERIPVNLHVSYDMFGNIIIEASLGILAIGTGTIMSERLPSLEGIWECTLDNEDIYEITVTENEVRGLSHILEYLCCEVGDRIRMMCNTDTRQVAVLLIEESE